MIAVAASRIRVEEKLVLERLERRGMACEHLDPRAVWAAADGAIRIGRGDPRHYRAVLDRELAQTRGLSLAQLLTAARITVLDSAEASAICHDKMRTAVTLVRAGIATPRTYVALTPGAARAAAAELGFPCVVKPVSGSWGRMVSLVRDPDALDAILEHREALPSPAQQLVVVQEYIDKPGRDIRAIVIGGRLIGAMYRSSGAWRTNVACGATTSPCTLDATGASLAIGAAAAVGARIAGVDLVEERSGRLLVLEVNHVVEFRGFTEAHGGRIDVAGAIVDELVAAADEAG